MTCRERFFVLSFVAIFSLLINLIFTNAAQAQLTIIGSNQMSVNTYQTLTASGGSGGYSWAIASGGGSINGSGASVTFTAPLSNSNCTSNANICVTDSNGATKCIQIAINQNIYNDEAVLYNEPYWEHCHLIPPHTRAYDAYYYFYQSSYRCDGMLRWGPIQRTLAGVSGGSFNDCTDAYAWVENWCVDIYGVNCSSAYNAGLVPSTHYLPPGYNDTRTETMKAAGCCPAQLLSSDAGKGTNDTGNSCTVAPANSSANLKSGNLYHSQDVGILTLSYNSIDTIAGTLGGKWTHQYNQNLTALSGNATIILRTEDGNVIYYHLSGGVYYPDAISGDTSTIIKYTNGTFGRTTKSRTVYYYNSAGQLTSIVDKNGNTTTLTYSGGYLATITDPNGRTTTLTSSNGYINYITDPGGRTYTLGYTNNLLTYIADPLGNAWTFTYDANGRMLSKRDPANRAVTYTYDAGGKILSSTDPEGLTRSMSYTASGETAFTEKDGSLWTYKYDPTYTVKTQATDPLGNTTRYIYDAKRNLTTTLAPDGSTTSYTYDANGNKTSMTDPLGNVTRYTYNSLNLVSTMTDPKGGITTYTYDSKGNPVTIVDPAGAATTYAYDAKGNVTSITDARGKITSFAYDGYNNLTSVTDQRGKVTTFTYDTVGNRLTATDPLGHTTTYAYNALNQMTQVTDPRGYRTYYTHDYQGNILTTTDAKGNPTTYAYNYRGNVTQMTDALDKITQMTYGPASCGSGCGGAEKISSLTDALNHTTAYTYDAAGRLTQETDPQGRHTYYAYDANGRMTSKTKPDGRTIYYTYDAAGRLTERRYPDNTVNNFSYDANGNLTNASNAWIAYNFGYNANNRLTGVTDSNTRSITYQYDAAGNRTAMTAPDGATTTYAYDNSNRVLNISNSSGTYAFAYDDAGRRSALYYPNGSIAVYVYDNSNNLTQIRHYKGTKTLAQINYTYDPINNRSNRTDTYTADSYVYDNISRLTYTNNSGGETYTYDGVGNRLTGPFASDVQSYNAGNEQLIRSTGVTYQYDLNGNRIKSTENGSISYYTYDDENRLTKVTRNGNVFTYTYDPFGRRIEKNVNGAITKYVYDNEDIVMEYDGLDNIKARYTHGPGIDEPLAVKQGSTNYYYHADGLGSIVALSNATGKAVQLYRYDPFGRFSQSGSVTQPYLYTAREYDTETALYYYRARYYDQRAGRFITRDPISFAGGDANLYAYVGNNPVNWIDPAGLAGCYVSYPGYPIAIPGTSAKVPLTHAGILSYNDKGKTRYYEYGRYDSNYGNVRRRGIPDLELGPDGKPTPESWAKLQNALNKIGNGTEAKTNCDDTADADKINKFAEQRMNDPNRAPYSWSPLNFNTCTTFASDALGAGLK
ncbi:MAG: hypothetical protein CVU51_03790 [Deltaproteobacteria bacterium HGW-Deltaproteobacteria-1]|jgi:RHS repeat-associated protein|nr:MAG: hypothetical protein CVU51_03790 [Deltaproteobacteria bacterium HGW-Deltaproteobacteria-1]